MARAERHGTSLSLLFVDLDDLKGINDRHGHEAGDAVTQRVAKLMTCDRRRTGVAARIGGEEFALLLPETPQADALAIAAFGYQSRTMPSRVMRSSVGPSRVASVSEYTCGSSPRSGM